MKCVKCESENVCKNGFISEKQRWKCKACGRNQLEQDGRQKYDEKIVKTAFILFSEGNNYRAIGRILKVSNVSVLNWIKSFGVTEGRQSQTIEELRKNDEISVV